MNALASQVTVPLEGACLKKTVAGPATPSTLSLSVTSAIPQQFGVPRPSEVRMSTFASAASMLTVCGPVEAIPDTTALIPVSIPWNPPFPAELQADPLHELLQIPEGHAQGCLLPVARLRAGHRFQPARRRPLDEVVAVDRWGGKPV